MTKYWLGKKRSKETVEKVRKKLKELAKDPEYRKKCGVQNIGRKSTKKGRTYEEIYGKEKADELRRKCKERQNRLWKDKEYKENMINAHIGIESPIKGIPRPDMNGNQYAYKQGYTFRQGYKFILMRDHPNCNAKGYVAEHRLKMEKQIGRYLKSSEVVHHIDGDVSNNRITNLMLFPNVAAHTKFHRMMRKIDT